MKDYIKDTLDYYDNNIDSYKSLWLDDFSNNYNFEIPDIFLSYLDKNSKILDMGCGTGRDSKYFKELGHIVKSIDGSLEMCKVASNLLNEEVEQLNFLNINYKEEFDGIFACASLLHLSSEDLLIVLRKISNALKENGILYTCFKYGEEERFEERYYNDMTLDKFKEITKEIKELKLIKSWKSEQQKTNRQFINFILRKEVNYE